MGTIVVRAIRGTLTESVHTVNACVTTPLGEVLFAAGPTNEYVVLRSAIKPFVAAALIAANNGVIPDGLDRKHVAVISGSHQGEGRHVAAVRDILKLTNLGPDALECGAHPPRSTAVQELLNRRREPFTALHNNCSGNHAGLLLLSQLLEATPSGYTKPGHPTQRFLRQFLCRLFDLQSHQLLMAVDGCSMPTFAIPMKIAATAYARFASLRGSDEDLIETLRVVREAMVAEPDFVGGVGSFDTYMLQQGGGTLVGKCGAEGFYAVGSITQNIGIAVKIADGGNRARPPAVIALLRHYGLLPDGPGALPDFGDTIYSNGGQPVGTLEAQLHL